MHKTVLHEGRGYCSVSGVQGARYVEGGRGVLWHASLTLGLPQELSNFGDLFSGVGPGERRG